MVEVHLEVHHFEWLLSGKCFFQPLAPLNLFIDHGIIEVFTMFKIIIYRVQGGSPMPLLTPPPPEKGRVNQLKSSSGSFQTQSLFKKRGG